MSRAEIERLRAARARELHSATEALDAREKCLQRLKIIDAEIDGIEIEQRSANRRRRIANLKLANAVYRDGSPRDTAGHREIVHRYAWGQQARNAPLRRGSPSLVSLLQLRDLERLWSVRYRGTLPNDDAGQDDLWIAAQLISRRQGNIVEKVVAWARVWAPWCSATESAARAAHVVRHPYKFKADTLAEKVGLTYAERQSLGITTIGAIDADLAERTRRRRERARAVEKLQRRAKGVRPRDVYEECSAAAVRPWEDEGVSRRTWYRNRARARVGEKSCCSHADVEQQEQLLKKGKCDSQPSNVEAQPSQNGRVDPSLGRVARHFEGVSAADAQSGTGLRSAGFVEANAWRIPVSAPPQVSGVTPVSLTLRASLAPRPHLQRGTTFATNSMQKRADSDAIRKIGDAFLQNAESALPCGIEAGAKRRLADEYDAAQERREVATQGDPRPSQAEGLATAADIGLAHKQIHEARILRDAEAAQPGIVLLTLDRQPSAGIGGVFSFEVEGAGPHGSSPARKIFCAPISENQNNQGDDR